MKFVPMSKLTPEQRVARAFLMSAERNGGPDGFWVSSRWLHERVQWDYERHQRDLQMAGLMEEVTPYQRPTRTQAGRCRIWRLTNPDRLTELAQVPADAIVLTGRTLEERQEEVHRCRFLARTNIAELAQYRYAHFSAPDDGRFYTEFAGLPALVRAHLTIDGEPTASIDISACYPTLVPVLLRHLQIPGLEDELAVYSDLGGALVRAEAASDARVPISAAKAAFMRVMFHPSAISYPGEWADSRWVLTEAGAQQARAVAAFRRRFPRIYRALRRHARTSARSPYFGFSQLEGQLRRQVKRTFAARYGYPPESVHDGFHVKARHAEALRQIIIGVATHVFFISKLNVTTSQPHSSATQLQNQHRPSPALPIGSWLRNEVPLRC